MEKGKQTQIAILALIFIPALSIAYGQGGEENSSSSLPFESCLSSPENVVIECRTVNVRKAACVDTNVISIPRSDENDNFGEINCTSPAPIDLTFVGYQLDDFVNASFVRNAENVFNEATYVFSVSFPLSKIKASREVVVSRHANPEQKLSFFLFRPDPEQIFSSNLKPNIREFLPVTFTEKNLVIPCISNNPEITPTLTASAPTSTLEYSYDKTKGFIIKTEINSTLRDPSGKYTCSGAPANSTKAQTVLFDVLPKQGKYIQLELG